MKARIIIAVASCLFFAGCGGPTIDKSEAEEIAALSQDSDQYLKEFTEVILELSGRESCSADFMREYGGFMRSSSDTEVYFLYCNEPMSVTNRWYVNVKTGQFSRTPAAL